MDDQKVRKIKENIFEYKMVVRGIYMLYRIVQVSQRPGAKLHIAPSYSRGVGNKCYNLEKSIYFWNEQFVWLCVCG